MPETATLPDTLSPLDTASQSLGLAEKELSNALVKLQAEEERLQATRLDLAGLTDQVKASDPDADPKAFSRLVQARDAARGREEALLVRVETAGKVREEREAAAGTARLDLLRAQLDKERAVLRTSETATTITVREAVDALLNCVKQHQAQVDRVRRASIAVFRASGQTAFDCPSVHTAWSGVPVAETTTALTSVGQQLGLVIQWERAQAAQAAKVAAGSAPSSLAGPSAAEETGKTPFLVTAGSSTTHLGENLHRSVRVL